MTAAKVRPEKIAIVRELRGKLEQSQFVILVDHRGMNVARMERLRRDLREAGAAAQVVPNRLLRHASAGLTPEGFAAALTGPSMMIYGAGDITRTAKVLKAFVKEHEMPAIKLGALQGRLLSAAEVDALALLPSREQLLAQLVGVLAAPMSRLVGVLHQKVATILYVLKAIQEKKEKGA